MPSNRALYIDMNSFFASCEQQDNPAWRNKPVAVVPMMTDSTSILAASYEAKAFGVKTNVKVRDAKKMCPGLILTPARHGPYVRYHHLAHQAIETVLPVHSVCSIDEFACELTGTQLQEDRARDLSGKIKLALQNLVGTEIRCSIGIASNFLLAKMACDMQKPDGLTILTDANRVQRLCELNLQDVPGIGPRMNDRLYSKGITNFSQLLACSEQEMRTIWGSLLGARFYRLLRGEWITPQARSEAKSISHEHVLPPRDRSFQNSYRVAQKLLWKAAIRLRNEGFLCGRVTLAIRYLDQESFYQDLDFDPTLDSGILLQKLALIFSRSTRKAKPIKVSVILSKFVHKDHEQLSLFSQVINTRPSAYLAVDAINKKYGRQAICSGALLDQQKAAPTRIAFSRIPELEELDLDE